MSRLTGFLLTVICTLGAGMTGYYAHLVVTLLPEMPTVDAIVHTVYQVGNDFPHSLFGPALLLLGIFFHRWEINNARNTHARLQGQFVDECELRVDAERQLEKSRETMQWVEKAIDDAVARNAKPPKDTDDKV